MVRSLHLLLLSNTGLLKQIGDDVATAKLSTCREMDADELSEPEFKCPYYYISFEFYCA